MKAKIRLPCKAVTLVLLFLVGFLIAGVLFPIIGLRQHPSRAKQTRDLIKRGWLCGFSRILNLKIITKGEISPSPALIVSNHISWLDILVLGQLVPGCFAAKDDISSWPVIGYLARQAGTVFIRRGDKQQILQTVERMAWQLRQNGNMLVFPEGTTTDGSAVLAFHGSLFQPALLTQAAIQPVAIRYIGEVKETAPFIGADEFVTHLLQMLTMEKIEVSVDFLPMIDGKGKTRHRLSSEAKERIETVLFSENHGKSLIPPEFESDAREMATASAVHLVKN
jgi:1-acyl-sn-glycerol-3-phosphate acyltransferase